MSEVTLCYLAVNYLVSSYPYNLLQIFGSRKVMDIISISYLIVYPQGQNIITGELLSNQFDVSRLMQGEFPSMGNHPVQSSYRLNSNDDMINLAERLWDGQEKPYGAFSPANFRRMIKMNGISPVDIGNELYYLCNPHIEHVTETDPPFMPNNVEIIVADPMEYFALCTAMEHLHGEPAGFRMRLLANPPEPKIIRKRSVYDIGSVDWLARIYHQENSGKNDVSLPSYSSMDPTEDEQQQEEQ